MCYWRHMWVVLWGVYSWHGVLCIYAPGQTWYMNCSSSDKDDICFFVLRNFLNFFIYNESRERVSNALWVQHLQSQSDSPWLNRNTSQVCKQTSSSVGAIFIKMSTSSGLSCPMSSPWMADLISGTDFLILCKEMAVRAQNSETDHGGGYRYVHGAALYILTHQHSWSYQCQVSSLWVVACEAWSLLVLQYLCVSCAAP